MKKIFLMIGAAIGALFPFSRANADECTSYEYNYYNHKLESYKERCYDVNGVMTSRSLYSCDSNGNCNQWENHYYDSDGNRIFKEYNSNCSQIQKNCTSDIENFDNGWSETYTTYDGNGNIVSKSVSRGGNAEEYYRCSNNICTLSYTKDDKGKFTTYDCSGNTCTIKSMTKDYNKDSYDCTSGTCHARKYCSGNYCFYYSDNNNLTGGYSAVCYTPRKNSDFTCSGSGANKICKCDNSNTVLDPSIYENFLTAPTMEMPSEPYCGRSYYAENGACKKCPDNTDSCTSATDFECARDYAVNNNGECEYCADSRYNRSCEFDDDGNRVVECRQRTYLDGDECYQCSDEYASSCGLSDEGYEVPKCADNYVRVNDWCMEKSDCTNDNGYAHIEGDENICFELDNCDGDNSTCKECSTDRDYGDAPRYIKNGTCSACPDGSDSCYLDDNNRMVTSCESGLLEQGGACVSSCGSGYKQVENWCNRIQYTPAEAAQVLRNDNTNEVTITFRK